MNNFRVWEGDLIAFRRNGKVYYGVVHAFEGDKIDVNETTLPGFYSEQWVTIDRLDIVRLIKSGYVRGQTKQFSLGN